MSNKDEIFEYVMNSPENTNPNVLRNMLDNLNTSSSEGTMILTETVTVEPGDKGEYEYTYTLNKTVSEIIANLNCAVHKETNGGYKLLILTEVAINQTSPAYQIKFGNDFVTYSANTENDYPAYSESVRL